MKRAAVLFTIFISAVCLTACAKDRAEPSDSSVRDEPEKICDDIAADHIQQVNIDGNARSIIIRQGADEYFAFYNGDLNKDHTYEVRYEEKNNTIDIHIMMENGENDNDILGSVLIDIPQKEFEKIDVTGDFRQISLYTVNSDVSIHDSRVFVNLDLAADLLTHDITLKGSEENAFNGVSLYLDQFPAHANIELSPLPNGTITDDQNMLKENSSAVDLEAPTISIGNTEKINIYKKD